MFNKNLNTICCGALVLVAVTHSTAIGDLITGNTNSGSLNVGPQYVAHSFTTPNSPQGWNNLTFNYFGIDHVTPKAAGTLYLFGSEFSGTPNDLASSTPIAASTSVVGNIWIFDAAATILPSTQYFVYSSAPVADVGFQSAAYSGGAWYEAPNNTSPYTLKAGGGYDLGFALNGTAATAAVPEPCTFTVLGMCAFGLIGYHRRRNATAPSIVK